MNKIELKSIGFIKTPFDKPQGMPIQPTGAKGINGEIHLKEEYIDGLKDLEEFSHIILIYYLHLTNGNALQVKPYMDNKSHGVFATRSPKRPNNIGLSTVKLESIDGNIIHISNIDVVDKTPL
nr:tRNA (N6-threonylcarbamoyladenosine(37)-N6)-methyltransferase TrmO [uncultured Methanobrevibacter sp.]